MKHSFTRRSATAGAVTLAAAAALVGVTTTPATAATTATTNYSCTAPGVFTSTFPVNMTFALLPTTAPAGFPVPAGLLSFTSTVTIPADIASQLGTFGVNGGKSDDFSTTFGPQSVPSPTVWNSATTNPDSSVTFSGKGSNAAFGLPAAGAYDVSMPSSFTMIPTSNGAGLPVNVACTSTAPSALGSVSLTKQVSTTKAKAPKTAKKGAAVKVKITVTNEYSRTGGPAVTGKVVLKDGKKKVGTATVRAGQAKVVVKKLKPGAHKLVATYAGDTYTDKSASSAITITVSN